jgi:hypothetical protein
MYIIINELERDGTNLALNTPNKESLHYSPKVHGKTMELASWPTANWFLEIGVAVVI